MLCLLVVLPFKHTLLYVFKCKLREREQPPRFAQPGTFEFEYASRWKALDEMEKQQREQVDRNIREAKEKLEAEMEAARHEHQLMLMRQGKNGFSYRCGMIFFFSLGVHSPTIVSNCQLGL